MGDSGKIIKTTNSGINWIAQNSGTTLDLKAVRFFNDMTGWIAGGSYIYSYPYTYEYGLVLRTSNGGNTWETPITPSPMGNLFHDISILDQNNLYITCGGASWNWGFSVGYLFKSSNSGINWVNIYMSGIPDIAFKSVDFINLNTGWACGIWTSDVGGTKSKLGKTTNQGINWSVITIDSTVFLSESTRQQLRFSNANTGYFLQYHLRKSTNGGFNWFNTDSLSTVNASKFYFCNKDTGWIVFPSGGIKRTNNGGYNWTYQNTPVSGFKGIYFINPLTGWAVGNNGIIVKTTTGGLTGINKVFEIIPEEYSLEQNYPNPFNQSTMFKVQCPIAGNVRVAIYDVTGKEVAVPVNEKLEVGTYIVRFDARDLPSGTYFYKLISGNYSEIRKMVMIK